MCLKKVCPKTVSREKRTFISIPEANVCDERRVLAIPEYAFELSNERRCPSECLIKKANLLELAESFPLPGTRDPQLYAGKFDLVWLYSYFVADLLAPEKF